MQQSFFELADYLDTLLKGDEVYTAWFEGEVSDFVRFNRGKVRQPGSVRQRVLSVDLIRGQKHAAGTVTLSGETSSDRERAATMIARLRDKLQFLSDDPHLLYNTEIQNSERIGENRLLDGTDAVDRISQQAQGHDFVAIYASGPIYRGFANSLGQRNWFANHSFNLDWSLYAHGDKAVKSGYAGFEWDDGELASKMQSAAAQLQVLQQPAKTIEPGEYSVYLAPTAVHELLWLLSWGCFGLKSNRTKSTSLLRMVEDGARFNERITLRENTGESTGPAFSSKGFLKPDQVELIGAGGYADSLVSPRSAKEYGVGTNGANAEEIPEALDMSPGTLARDEAAAKLGTGLYVNNLWYLNFSDKPAGRVTGMTRFATLWVENGQVVAPVNVMRFDDTLYRMFGDKLEALTRERDFMLDSDTYFARSTGSKRLPGALVRDVRLTL